MTLIIVLWCLVGLVSGVVWKMSYGDLKIHDLAWLCCPVILGPIWLAVFLLYKYGDKTIIKKK